MTEFIGFKFSLATDREVNDRRRWTVEQLNRPDPEQPVVVAEATAEYQKSARLPSHLLQYLQLIDQTSDLKTSERDKRFGVSSGTGNRYRRQLEELGLIEIRKVSPGAGRGRGKTYLEIHLTDAGKSLLNARK